MECGAVVMSQDALYQIFEAVGGLTKEVEGLRRDMQQADTRSTQSNHLADQQRATIHRRMDELVEQVGVVSAEVSAMQSDVTDSKKVTDEVKQWKQRGIGALFVTGLASAAVSGVVVGFVIYWWDAIMRALRSA